MNYARNTKDPYRLVGQLCTVGSISSKNGGTYARNRMDILSHYGVQSRLESPSVEKIARYVGEGRGVIISVDASALWKINDDIIRPHAVVVTSLMRDSKTESPLEFYICDSGSKQSCMTVTAVELQGMLLGDMNVTNQVIR